MAHIITVVEGVNSGFFLFNLVCPGFSVCLLLCSSVFRGQMSCGWLALNWLIHWADFLLFLVNHLLAYIYCTFLSYLMSKNLCFSSIESSSLPRVLNNVDILLKALYLNSCLRSMFIFSYLVCSLAMKVFCEGPVSVCGDFAISQVWLFLEECIWICI